MPTTDAINTGAELLFQYPSVITRLSTGSSPPNSADEVTSALRVVSVTQSAGGQMLDNASIEWWVTDNLINRTQPANFSRMIDALSPDANATRLSLGDYVTEIEKVDGGERLTAQSHLRGYHFGVNHGGQWWYDPLATDEVRTEFAPVFNPRVDGKILGNRSDEKHVDADQDAYYFIHPEATLTTEAETESNLSASLWILKDAVAAMCWECNFDETFIRNPSSIDLAVLYDAPTLEDVHLTAGQTLPYYLDSLLQPLGYNWFVDYDTGTGDDPVDTYLGKYANDTEANADNTPSAGDTYFNTTTGTTFERNEGNTAWVDTEAVDESMAYNKNKPKIVVLQKGVGTEKELLFQAPGESLDLDSSNINEYQITRRIGDSVNQVTAIGDVERAEVTIELFRGWPATDDTLTAADLDKSDPASVYATKPTVWRLWVGNEAGDYTGTRTEITAALDLSSVFSRWIPHRRQALDPFTFQGGSGRKQRRQIFVEYTVDAGSTWVPIPDEFGQPFVMPDQIGIIFQGNTPPEELILAGADAGIRITCVVEGDARLKSTATKQSYAVNARTVELRLDVPQKFRKHWVQSTGAYASVLLGYGSGADTVDDSTLIETYAEDIRDDNEVAELDCEFVMPGIHTSYQIGDLLTNIAGREVSLDQASDTAPAPRYPQITKREFRFEPSPSTILTVDRGVRVRRSNA